MKRFCVSACLLGVPCRWKGDAKPCEAVQRLAERAAVRAFDPATRSVLEIHHAEFAEGAEPKPHAEDAEFAEGAEGRTRRRATKGAATPMIPSAARARYWQTAASNA